MTLKTPIFSVFVLTALLALSYQGSRAINGQLEGLIVSGALDMVKTGDWIHPRPVNHQIDLTQPPLPYWGVAASLSLLGHNEWGARCFHAICYFLTVVLVFLIANLALNHKAAAIVALLYSMALGPNISATIVDSATPYALFLTGSLYCFIRSVNSSGQRTNFWKPLFFFLIGLAFLTRGAGVLFVPTACLVWLIYTKNFKHYILNWTLLPCTLVFFVVILPWYAVMAASYTDAEDFIINSLFERHIDSLDIVPSRLMGNAIYFPILFASMLPSLFIILPFLSRDFEKEEEGKLQSLSSQNSHISLLIFWVIAVILPNILFKEFEITDILPPLPFIGILFSLVFLSKSGLSIESESSRNLVLTPIRIGGIAVSILFLITSRGAAPRFAGEHDLRAVWQSIEPHLTTTPAELVVVDDELIGLDFYSQARPEIAIEMVVSETSGSDLYIPLESVHEEVQETSRSRHPHLYLVRGKKNRQLVESLLDSPGTKVIKKGLSFDRWLFITPFLEPEENSLRLLVLGDFGTGDMEALMTGKAATQLYSSWEFDAGLMLGDNLYLDRDEGPYDIEEELREKFEIPLAPLINAGVPFYAVLGNHDARAPESIEGQLKYDLFNMEGRRYYSKVLREGLLEVFFIDYLILLDGGPAAFEQLAWLEDALESSSALWKVIAIHRSPRTTANEHLSSPALIDSLEPMFIENNVRVVLAGHNHIYERLHPYNGIHYITIGSSAKLRKHDLVPNAMDRAVGNDDRQVFGAIEVTPRYFRLKAIDQNGRYLDNWILNAEVESAVEDFLN